ncbi:hypothetical protein AMECASPLE_009480 [Ameca splendens]|uniref:Uncharacterized protein n=1 Tax=Ameca splendens TaxID=208324 RepID=A0ABV0ZM04_9TELE
MENTCPNPTAHKRHLEAKQSKKLAQKYKQELPEPDKNRCAHIFKGSPLMTQRNVLLDIIINKIGVNKNTISVRSINPHSLEMYCCIWALTDLFRPFLFLLFKHP